MSNFNKLNESGINWNSLMRKHALYYAESQGWQIIPLHSPRDNKVGGYECSCGVVDCSRMGKHPRIHDWVNTATTSSSIIKSWFNEWPDMNIGVVCGKESGLIVLDVDGPKGKRNLMSLPPVPNTSVAKSGVGLHYYFKYPTGEDSLRTVAGIMDGLDSRADKGYVCAPPSLHKRGYRYEWLQAGEITPAPEWWINMIKRPVARTIDEIKVDVKLTSSQVNSYGRIALESEIAKLYSTPIGEGKRNTNLNRASFSLYQLVAGGVLEEELVESCLLDAAINGMKMETREAMRTIESGKKGGLMKPRTIKND